MIFHDIDFLCILVKLNGFAMLRLAFGSGFFILMRPLGSVLLVVNLKYFILFRGVSGAMQQAYLFSSGQCITLVD